MSDLSSEGNPRTQSPISRTFNRLAEKEQSGLIPYITAGDPDLKMTAMLLQTLASAGADLIELGVPFSDPTADGPVIQRASERALAGGVSLRGIFQMLERLKKSAELPPIVLFGYYNPFLKFGLERLAERAVACGVAGFLVVDLPPEECGPFRKAIGDRPLDLIHLIAPTSNSARMQQIASEASGFLYFVSRTGVTGSRRPDPRQIQERLELLREVTDLPIAVGFGVRSPEQAEVIAEFADAVVVGSALVELVEQHSGGSLVLALERTARGLKEAIAGARL